MRQKMMLNYVLFLCLLTGGCTYISKTSVYIKAERASYPLGYSSIGLDNGEISMNREMNAQGMFKK